MRTSIALSALLSMVCGLSVGSTAQTLYTLDGPGGTVFEQTGPPGFCFYPSGPIVGGFPYLATVLCPPPAPVPFAPPFVGAIATDRVADTVWVTDGLTFSEFVASGPAAGTDVNGFFMPPGAILPVGPVTGMSFDAAAGILWVTDGAFIAGVVPPPAPGCLLPPGIAFPIFPSPAPAPLTDLAWDPTTLTLWACDLAGFVTNIVPGGAIGPGGVFPVAPGPPCGLAVPLTGIAYDTSTPNLITGTPPALYATDGVAVAYFNPPGFPAVIPTFYTPVACYLNGAPPANGLDFTLRPIAYGVGTDPTGLAPPVMGSTGQTSIPSGPGLALTLTGADATPGTVAGLIFGFGPACPPIPGLGGNLIYVAPPFTGPLGPFPVVAGALTLPIAIPATAPPGPSIYLQRLVGKGSGGIQVSNGLEFTAGLP
jgi:hypothetical protein